MQRLLHITHISIRKITYCKTVYVKIINIFIALNVLELTSISNF